MNENIQHRLSESLMSSWWHSLGRTWKLAGRGFEVLLLLLLLSSLSYTHTYIYINKIHNFLVVVSCVQLRCDQLASLSSRSLPCLVCHCALWGLQHSCLNTLSPVGGTIGEGLGVVASLEKVCHWGWTLQFQKTHTIPSVLLTSCL